LSEFYGSTIIRAPYKNVVVKDLTLKPEVVEWLKQCGESGGIGAFYINEYVEFWFKNKNNATLFKLMWT